MIDRLKTQQEKLIINERHEAWGNLARKLAHEIKNPLTPIQLTIDRLKNKYSDQISEKDKENFKEYLKVIIKQINQIENLVNEFSDFARMPKPILRNNVTKKVTIEIFENDEHISIDIIDNGIGFEVFKNNIKDILNPYFTTKKNGTGLGLSIVNKIISDHNGKLKFIPIENGAKIAINFSKNGN